MGQEMGGRFRKEGTYAYLWLIHVGMNGTISVPFMCGRNQHNI